MVTREKDLVAFAKLCNHYYNKQKNASLLDSDPLTEMASYALDAVSELAEKFNHPKAAVFLTKAAKVLRLEGNADVSNLVNLSTPANVSKLTNVVVPFSKLTETKKNDKN